MNRVQLAILLGVLCVLLAILAVTTARLEYRNYRVSDRIVVDMEVSYCLRNDWLRAVGRRVGWQTGVMWIPIRDHGRPPLDPAIVARLKAEIDALGPGCFQSCHGTLSPLGYSFQIAASRSGGTVQYINLEFDSGGREKRRVVFSQ